MIDLLEPAAEAATTTKAKKNDYDKQALAFIESLNQNGEYPLFHGGKFYVYAGNRYMEEAELAQRIRTFFRQEKWSQSNNVIGNVQEIVRNAAHKRTSTYPAMPFYFGADDAFAKPERIIAYRNGLLDLDGLAEGKRELIPHTWEWASSICLPYDYDPAATCPEFLRWQDEALCGDEDQKALHQEWCGYILANDISQQKLLIQVGPPRSGKGTSAHIMESLVGRENATGFKLHSLIDKFQLRQLVGKLLAVVGEAELAGHKDRYRILETLNSIVGGDSATIEEKFNPLMQSLVLTARFVVSCNAIPPLADHSGALAARLLVLEFPQSFEGREDRELLGRLLNEISGISTWALEGYLRLRRQGRFTEPQRSRDLLRAFRRDNCPTLAFAQDCLVIEGRYAAGRPLDVRTADGPLSVSKAALDAAYRSWCDENGVDCKLNWFARNLFAQWRQLPPYDKHRKLYNGFGLLSELPEPADEAPAMAVAQAAPAEEIPLGPEMVAFMEELTETALQNL